MPRKGHWMQTSKGRRIYPLDPRPGDVDVEEIAHALSNICRFGGHCREFYSVAQHSVIVAQCVLRSSTELANETTRRLTLCGLFHDGPEAFLGDVPRPLKHSGVLTDVWQRAEIAWALAIDAHLDLGTEIGIANLPLLVKVADDRVLLAEKRDLLPGAEGDRWGIAQSSGLASAPFPSEPVIPLNSRQAKSLFLDFYEQLRERSVSP